jgi:hypothetical protein
MQAERVAQLREMAADDAIPCEMVGGETTRIDQTALTGLIEKSEGIAIGTPKRGMPQLEEPEIEVVLARGSSQQFEATEAIEAAEVIDAVPVEVAPAREPSRPVMRQSRVRDFMIGGALSIVVMAAWYCATQL